MQSNPLIHFRFTDFNIVRLVPFYHSKFFPEYFPTFATIKSKSHENTNH